MSGTFTKNGDASSIRWEYLGLQWLREADGAAVVEVLSHSSTELVERRVSPGAATREAAASFARGLRVTHLAGAEAFGTPPLGWDQGTNGWIGMARLPLGSYDTWGSFYAELRVLPFARAAYQLGSLDVEGLRVIEQVCDRLRDGVFDDGEAPARIHGDLWGGNVLPGPDGFVMIDPAAHGGHPATDLAMLELFGAPHLETILSEDEHAAGWSKEWRSLIGLHQLHPLLVHAELFGGSYGNRAVREALRYL